MILVYGIGITGMAVCRFLVKNNLSFKAVDSKENPPTLKEFLKQFPKKEIYCGKPHKELLNNIEKIVISPGISLNDNLIKIAKKKNIPIIGDMDLFFQYVNAPVIGITGTNGKSTVTTLVTNMLNANNKKAVMGGNIGKAVLDCLVNDADFYVLELSSYQLDITKNMPFEVAIVLNIAPDHLDRYTSFIQYKKSKISIYGNANHKIINFNENYQDLVTSNLGFCIQPLKSVKKLELVQCHNNKYITNEDDILLNVDELKILGYHNIQNVLASLSIVKATNLLTPKSITSIKSFTGLKHRTQIVSIINGVTYINDSKATNTTASITAINMAKQKYNNIVLIAGGIAKKEDYQTWANTVKNNIKKVIVFGQDKDFLKTILKDCNVELANSLKESLETIKKYKNIDAVLLSPACASFDSFANFEKRGDAFIEYVSNSTSS